MLCMRAGASADSRACVGSWLCVMHADECRSKLTGGEGGCVCFCTPHDIALGCQIMLVPLTSGVTHSPALQARLAAMRLHSQSLYMGGTVCDC